MHHHHWHWLGVFFHQQAWLALPLTLLALVFASYSVLGLWRGRPAREINWLSVLSLVSFIAMIPFGVSLSWRGDLWVLGSLGMPKEFSGSAAPFAFWLISAFTAEYISQYGRRSRKPRNPALQSPDGTIGLSSAAASLMGSLLLTLTVGFMADLLPYIPFITYALVALGSVGLASLWMRGLLSIAKIDWRGDHALNRFFRRYAFITVLTIFGYFQAAQAASYFLLGRHWMPLSPHHFSSLAHCFSCCRLGARLLKKRS